MSINHAPPQATHRGGFFYVHRKEYMSHPSVTDFVDRLDANLRESYEERAAILQFDAGIERDLAEALALLMLIRQYPKEVLALLT